MLDQRLTNRLTDYWNLLRKDRALPDFSHFNSSALEDIWPSCMIFVVQPSSAGNARVYKCSAVGDKLTALYGADLTGTYVKGGKSPSKVATVMQKIDTVYEKPEPLYDQGQFVNDRSKIVKYRSCLLPFGNDHGVTHVVAGLSWREF